MKYLLYIIFIAITLYDVEAIFINEVMYNPEGSDNKKEFIEIFNDENLSFDGFIISDGDSNDTIRVLNLSESNFVLIVEDDYEIETNNVSIYNAGAAIGNGLSFEDTVSLYYPNGSLIDSIVIDKEVEEGYSLELFEGRLYQSLILNGTPGLVNSVNLSEQDFSVLEISEFLPDPKGYDDAAMPDGEWVELYNPSNIGIDLRGLKLRDYSNRELIITDVTTLDRTVIYSKGFLVVYMNSRSLLNNDGFEIIKLFDLNDTLIDEVSYSGSSEGLSWSKNNGIWQKSIPSPGEANKENSTSEEDSRIEIVRFYDLGSNEKVEWGSNFRVRLNIYKGNTNKNAIKIWVEKAGERISKEASVNVYDKFVSYNLTLALQLINNCDKKFKDGIYQVKTEGLNSEDLKNIEVNGYSKDACDNKEEVKKGFYYELVDYPSNVKINEEFPIKVMLINNQDNDEKVSVWSYVYSGRWSLSGEREENMQEIEVKSGESKIVELKNIVIESGSGKYNLKVKIKQEDRKTEDEITKDIIVIAPLKVEQVEDDVKVEIKSYEEKKESVLKGVVYESSSNKAKRSAIYFLAGILALFCLYLLYERE